MNIGGAGTGVPIAWHSADLCQRATPFLTNVKGYGVYFVPRLNVQVAATFRSVPGNATQAIFNANNAYLAANSTLGRPLAGGAANIAVALLERDTMYLDRRNELDLRFGLIIRAGRSQSVISLDLYNATNSSAVLQRQPELQRVAHTNRDSQRPPREDEPASSTSNLMPLCTGTKLGRYEITTLLGKGGMGEVYRARDPQLKRDVAIKVSTAEFTDRFRREAEAVAALNHPNICTLHDVGADHLVMELVEGPTLAERMAAGRDTTRRSVRAGAPDRGCARARARERHHSSRSETGQREGPPRWNAEGSGFRSRQGRARRARIRGGHRHDTMADVTQAGVILGTAAYMSPEQAAGQEVDRRTDIWAFGVVLYEMLSGTPLFRGETPLDTLALVRMKEPDWKKTPARARVLLKWCLEKNPAKRLRDIGDARLFLDEGPETFVQTEARPAKYRHLGWMAAAAVAVLAAAAGCRSTHPPSTGRCGSPRCWHLKALSTISWALVHSSPFQRCPRMAPDSCSAHARRMAKRPSSGSVRWIRSPRSRCQGPKVRPDRSGRRIVAMSPSGPADKALKKIDVLGGPPVTIAPLADTFQGGSWNAEGVIIFADNSRQSPIMKVSNGGGTPVRPPQSRRTRTYSGTDPPGSCPTDGTSCTWPRTPAAPMPCASDRSTTRPRRARKWRKRTRTGSSPRAICCICVAAR